MLLAECNHDCFNCIYDDCIETDRKIFEGHKNKIDWKNPDEKKAYMKRYRETNRSRIKAKKHEYYLNNREKMIENAKKWHRKQREM